MKKAPGETGGFNAKKNEMFETHECNKARNFANSVDNPKIETLSNFRLIFYRLISVCQSSQIFDS